MKWSNLDVPLVLDLN